MIPVRIIVTGNVDEGRKLVGFAKNQMAILRRAMSFQSLNEGHRTVTPYSGQVVECWASYSLEEIRIHVAQVPSGQAAEGSDKVGKKKKTLDENCMCFPHFAFAVVTKVTPALLGAGVLSTTHFSYDLQACAKNTYVLVKNVIDINYGRYYKGQYVLLAASYAIDSSKLALPRLCVMTGPKFDAYAIVPLHILDKLNKPLMKKWINRAETESTENGI